MNESILNDILVAAPSTTIKRAQIIYQENDESNGLYFVEKGMIGLFHISESGKETFLRVFGEKAIFGHRSYLAEENYHATTIALTEAKIKHISSSSFESILAENPSLVRQLLKKVSQDLGNAEIRMAGLQDKTTNQRIAESMLFLKLKYPEKTWTRKEIGEYSGSSFESVTRFMSLCESEGIIKKLGRDFEILDQEKLLNH